MATAPAPQISMLKVMFHGFVFVVVSVEIISQVGIQLSATLNSGGRGASDAAAEHAPCGCIGGRVPYDSALAK